MTRDINTNRINIDQPRWDQSTYIGRAKHFFVTTNPLNVLKTPAELDRAKNIVTRYRKGEKIPGLTEDELWRTKQIYDSAFHPDTGEKVFLIGRMSAQVPMNMVITGCMMTFYKTTKAVMFWQWCNQSFNAIVNYSNRSGNSPTNLQKLGLAYTCATTCAVATALGLNSLVTKAPPVIGRLVPFTAMAAANLVNVPIMRSKELYEGIPVTDEKGKRLGDSKVAARDGIIQVVFSRIFMGVPSMGFTPLLMDLLERRGFLTRYPMSAAPIQILLCGVCLTFSTPLCCAIFPQKSSISASRLEPDIQRRLRYLRNSPKILYYNKGL